MTPLDCFRAKIDAKIVSPEAGRRLEETVEAFRQERDKRAMRAEDAAMRAAADAADLGAKLASREAELALGNIEAQLRWLDTKKTYIERIDRRRADKQAPMYKGNNPGHDAYGAASSLLDRDPGEVGGWANVTYQSRNLRAQAHGKMFEAIDRWRATLAQQFKAAMPEKLVGKPDRVGDLELLGALYGKTDIDPNARVAAKGVEETLEWLRQTYVEAGGALPKRENWRLPNPVHDPLKVGAVNKQDWIDTIWDMLDRGAMLDLETGRRLSNERLQSLLSETYDRISANGATGAPTSAVTGKGALASSRAHHRFLVFKSAEDWLHYNDLFGNGIGVFDTVMHHIRSMSDDIASMQILGPNPEATARFIISDMEREKTRLRISAPLSDPAAVRQAHKHNAALAAEVEQSKKAFRQLYDEVSGTAAVPVNIVMASRAASVRSWLVATKLGSAAISQIADMGAMLATARMNGLPIMDMFNHVIKDLADGRSEINAVQLGMIADGLGLTFRDNDRFMGETIASHKAQHLASTVLRASGMRRLTGVERVAFAKTQMATFANDLGKDFAGLQVERQKALNRYELSAADWDIIRKATPLEPVQGGKFLTANDIRSVEGGAGRIADSYQRMLDNELDYAVLDTDPRVRAAIFGAAGAPGTWGGELTRMMMQFKSFSMMIGSRHMARATAYGWDGSRLSHGALTFIAMSMFGMVALQAKEIAKGRDPLSMDPTTRNGMLTWGAAVLSGGGLGVFGDLIFQDQTRQSTSLGNILAGPVLGDVDKVLGDWLIKNAYLAARGKETHFTGDALYVLGGLVPGQSLWYARTAFQRSVLDQLALMIDDRAPERFRRVEKEAEKSWGQRLWWDPGAPTPRRAPDPAAALGSSR